VRALELLLRNAEANGVRLEAAQVDWAAPHGLLRRGPFDLALASDVLYEGESVAPLLALLPDLASQVWIADPGRRPASGFLETAANRWRVSTSRRGVVGIHKLVA
jgi:predicted nicotinamide N-methyase